jgi:hypothetical protein
MDRSQQLFSDGTSSLFSHSKANTKQNSLFSQSKANTKQNKKRMSLHHLEKRSWSSSCIRMLKNRTIRNYLIVKCENCTSNGSRRAGPYPRSFSLI